VSRPAALAAITGIGPVGRPGVGLAELLAGPGVPDTPASGWRLHGVSAFDPAAHLGPKGWKFLPPVTRAALAASRLALADAGLDVAASLRDAGEAAGTASAQERSAVVIGTNFAVAEINDRIDRALLAGGIAGISAVECPNFAVNVPASQVSITHRMKAFNVTLVNLLTAGCEAILLAARGLADGRADTALAGAIEGPPPAAAAGVLGGEADAFAACLLHLETPARARARDAEVYAWLTGGLSRVLPAAPAARAAALDTALTRALTETDGPPANWLHLCVPAGPAGAALGTAARSWADGQLGAGRFSVTRGAPQASATSVLWLARALAQRTVGELLLAVAGPQGHLVVLRLSSGEPS